jgi:transcriptional regulator with XRE-family HTH domain
MIPESQADRVKYLRDLRELLGLSQMEMAREIDVSMRAYQALEGGESKVGIRHIRAFNDVAFERAVVTGNPMLAPASVRKRALDLVRLITGG